ELLKGGGVTTRGGAPATSFGQGKGVFTPSVIVSFREIGTGCRPRRAPFTNVPFEEPRSASVYPEVVWVNSQCRLETSATGTTMSQPGTRPIIQRREADMQSSGACEYG